MEKTLHSKPVVIHCIPALFPGGTERMLAQTIQRLTGYTHYVCCLLRGGPIAEELRVQGIPVEVLQIHAPYRSGIIAFRKFIRDHRPAMIVTYLPLADIIGKIVGRIEGIPVILCSLRSTLRDWRYLPLIALEVITGGLATHYIAVSEAVKKRFICWGLRGKDITVVPNGIDIQRFSSVPSADGWNVIRRKEGVDPNDVLLIVVGNLRKERGHAFVFNAFKQALPDIKHTSCLWVIGDGPERSSLEALTAQLGIQHRVRFLGFRNDLHQLLPAADIAISSSLYEGMSNALLEVMAAGLAIIAVDVPENQELILNKQSGILVPPRSIHALAQAIVHLGNSSSIREQFGRSARQSVQRFSIEQSIDGLDKLYRRFLSITDV